MRGPIRVLDASPTCDGAAAIVLTSNRDAALKGGAGGLVRLSGSGAASDILCVADRPDPLSLGLTPPHFEPFSHRFAKYIHFTHATVSLGIVKKLFSNDLRIDALSSSGLQGINPEGIVKRWDGAQRPRHLRAARRIHHHGVPLARVGRVHATRGGPQGKPSLSATSGL